MYGLVLWRWPLVLQQHLPVLHGRQDHYLCAANVCQNNTTRLTRSDSDIYRTLSSTITVWTPTVTIFTTPPTVSSTIV